MIEEHDRELDSIKVGDEVACGRAIMTVTKITPTQIVCGCRRFSKLGRPVGGGTWITANQAVLAEAKKKAIIYLTHHASMPIMKS